MSAPYATRCRACGIHHDLLPHRSLSCPSCGAFVSAVIDSTGTVIPAPPIKLACRRCWRHRDVTIGVCDTPRCYGLAGLDTDIVPADRAAIYPIGFHVYPAGAPPWESLSFTLYVEPYATAINEATELTGLRYYSVPSTGHAYAIRRERLQSPVVLTRDDAARLNAVVMERVGWPIIREAMYAEHASAIESSTPPQPRGGAFDTGASAVRPGEGDPL